MSLKLICHQDKNVTKNVTKLSLKLKCQQNLPSFLLYSQKQYLTKKLFLQRNIFLPKTCSPNNSLPTIVFNQPFFFSDIFFKKDFSRQKNFLSKKFSHLNKIFKNPAYGRQCISRPMRIVAPIPQ